MSMNTKDFLEKLYTLEAGNQQYEFTYRMLRDMLYGDGTSADFIAIEVQIDPKRVDQYVMMFIETERSNFFAKDLSQVVDGHPERVDEISREFNASIPTVHAWAMCQSLPQEFVQQLVLKFIKRYSPED